MDDQIKRNCPACGVTYDANPSRLKFGRQTACSRACSYKLRSAGMKRGKEHQCGGCGNLVYRPPSGTNARHGDIFCSPKCAYANRKRVVTKPYIMTAVVDYSASAKKAWDSRRRNPKPYPDSAREKAAARAIQRIKDGGGVSKFEIEAAKIFGILGFCVLRSVPLRSGNGTFAHVFDIILPLRGIIIECHGTYFHGGRWSWIEPDATQRKNLLYEERKMASSREIGLDLRILWEHEFKKDKLGACLSVVR